jgi:hypothetical protein
LADKGARPERYREEFTLQVAKLIVEGGPSTVPKMLKYFEGL